MTRAPNDRGEAGFTLVEVLIALAVVAITIVAVGSVVSTNARGVRALEDHVALIQTAQTVFTTGIPPRKDLALGSLAGQLRDYRWQVNIGPVSEWGSVNGDPTWIPELVKIRVRSPSGAAIDLETVRLMRGQKR
jgi:general secretion pathway protein I